MDLRPGKGVHLVLNQEVLDFVEKCFDDTGTCYSDYGHDENPTEILKNLLEMYPKGDPEGWQEQKDDFGHKVFRAMKYKKGELRVTVVLTKQIDRLDELRIDVREWYNPNEAW